MLTADRLIALPADAAKTAVDALNDSEAKDMLTQLQAMARDGIDVADVLGMIARRIHRDETPGKLLLRVLHHLPDLDRLLAPGDVAEARARLDEYMATTGRAFLVPIPGGLQRDPAEEIIRHTDARAAWVISEIQAIDWHNEIIESGQDGDGPTMRIGAVRSAMKAAKLPDYLPGDALDISCYVAALHDDYDPNGTLSHLRGYATILVTNKDNDLEEREVKLHRTPDVRFVWRVKAKNKDGQRVEGSARIIPADQRIPEGPDAPIYKVELDLAVWLAGGETSQDGELARLRLLHHELTHCGGKAVEGKGGRWEWKAKKRPHDVEENLETAKRFAPVPQVAELVEAVQVYLRRDGQAEMFARPELEEVTISARGHGPVTLTARSAP